MRNLQKTAWTILGVFCLLLGYAQSVAPVNSIPVKIINHAGAPIQVFWIDTFSEQENLVPQTSKPLRNSSDTNINSYNGHQFVVKFLDDIPGVEAFFTKGPNEETVLITYDEETNVMTARQITKFDEIMDLINQSTETCGSLKDSAFAECIGDKVIEEVRRLQDTTNEIKRYRDLMLPRLYEYICSDNKPNFTEPLRTLPFEDRKERYDVKLMVETDRAKVWVVPNAISSRECELLQTHSVPVQAEEQKAIDSAASGAVETQNDGTAVATSSSAIIDAAKQARIAPQKVYQIAQRYSDKDPLWPLYSKVFKMTHFVSKHRLPVVPSGQEGFGLSTYGVGEGVGPHCAGACDSTPYKEGERVASALMFCQAAEEGGVLMFPKSDVVIRPSVGMGVFFTYKHHNTTETDEGYSEHSLCPVRAGQHKIVSLHLRSGVAKVTAPALGTGPDAAAAPVEAA